MKLLLALLLLFCSPSWAALTDIRFGQYQVADSQWNVSACTQTTTCQIYSKNPGVAYKIPWTSGQLSWATGDYIKFELSGNASWPYTARQYSSNGTIKATLGQGKIINIGPDYFFFVGSDNNTGQLFSGSSGMNSTAGVTWTGTLNPTIQQVDAYADANYSTTPLEPGQTATTTPNSGGGGATYSSDITPEQTNILNSARTRQSAIVSGNRIDLEVKIGTNNPTITIEQSGNYNLIQGLGGGNAIIDGDNNTLTVKQGSVTGRNLIELGLYGDNNSVTIWQARNPNTGLVDAGESGGHYTGLGINGNYNTANIKQSNAGAASSGHFSLLYITGSNNTMTAAQTQNNEKKIFGTITGSNNVFNIAQNGSGNHYADILLTGNGHTANITQTGSGTHRATINLQNITGASILNLTQQGTTGQQYNITQQCANLQGCTVTVTQGTGP